MAVAAVPFRHLGKESFCRLPVAVRIAVGQDVPVDDDVHTERGRRLHAPVQHHLKLRLIPAGGVAAVFLSVHRQPDAVRAPAVPQRLKRRPIHVLRIPSDAVRAHALQLDGFPMAVSEIDTLYTRHASCRKPPRHRREHSARTKSTRQGVALQVPRSGFFVVPSVS